LTNKRTSTLGSEKLSRVVISRGFFLGFFYAPALSFGRSGTALAGLAQVDAAVGTLAIFVSTARWKVKLGNSGVRFRQGRFRSKDVLRQKDIGQKDSSKFCPASFFP
jgi:hypothetical protein